MDSPFQDFARALAYQLPAGWSYHWPGSTASWPLATAARLVGPEGRVLFLCRIRRRIAVYLFDPARPYPAFPPGPGTAVLTIAISRTIAEIAREIERYLLRQTRSPTEPVATPRPVAVPRRT